VPANPKTRVVVDPDQKDAAKAVERVAEAEDRRLPGKEDSEGTAERSTPNAQELSRSMRKRMAGFERNLRKQFDQQTAETQAELQRMRRENEELRKSVGSGRTTTAAADEAAHEAEMSALEARHTKALEDGNSSEATKLARLMARKEAEFMNAKTAAALGQTQATARREREERTEEQPAQQQSRKPTSTGLKFVKAQQDWWDDPEFAAERGAANALHAVMVENEDSDPASEEHYEELARRLKAKFPKLDIGGAWLKTSARDDDDGDDVEDEEAPVRQPRRAPVQNFRDRGDASAQTRRKGGVHLNERDFATMRAVGMNPESDKDLRAFAQSKRETAAEFSGASR